MRIFKVLILNKKLVLFIVVLALLAFGVFMTLQKSRVAERDIIDAIWAFGDPIAIEQGFNNLLEQKKIQQDMSTYLQILTQLALAQALQKKFDEAHATLDKAEKLLTNDNKMAQVRIQLEHGRVFHQSGNISQARNYFEQTYALSAEYKFDYHTVNAAHMIAIVAASTDEKIAWNKRAIAIAMESGDKRAQEWLGSLYNNLGQNYLEAGQFENALSAFKWANEYREKEGYAPNIRFANWAIARALRSLNRIDEALAIHLKLLDEYNRLAANASIDMPMEMFTLTRGWIHEELAELYAIKAKKFAKLAYDELSNNVMFQDVEPQRIKRLEQLQK